MSPVDRAGPLTGTSFALGSYEKIQPGFRDEKRPKILGTSFGAKLEKQNKDGETQQSYYFRAYHALVTLLAVSQQLNGLPMIWKIPQEKQTTLVGLPCCGNEIIRCVIKLRCFVIDHLTHALLRRIHPGNRDGVFIWQKFLARLPRSRLEKPRSR